ncbi:MAG: cyclic nucleotide-binding domain-containing protein, partial [Planctomycetes bacterium]|nr:cyclic nucleotide-binding domain-containing protein [Planctomycetota bacterium]
MLKIGKTFKEAGKDIPKGTVLFKEGDTGDEMYLICAGEVKLTRKTPKGEIVLTVLGFGEFFGEMSVITNKPRTISAETITDCRLNIISKSVLETLIS